MKRSEKYFTIFFHFVETLLNAVSSARGEDKIQWKLRILSEDESPQQNNDYVNYSKILKLILLINLLIYKDCGLYVISYIFTVATKSTAFILLNRLVLSKFLLLIKPLEDYNIPLESTPQKRKQISQGEELDIQSVKKNFKNLNFN
jgi:hypothetical protein